MRTEWKTMTLYMYLGLVFEICETLKSKRLATSKIDCFLDRTLKILSSN